MKNITQAIYPSFILLGCAIILYIFLRLLERILLKATKNAVMRKKVTFLYPLVSYVLWIVFLTYVFFHVAVLKPLVILPVVGALLFLTRSFLQNFFSGVLFRIEKGDLRGTSLKIAEDKGVVVSFHSTTLCLQLEGGAYVYVPYEKCYKEGFSTVMQTEVSDKQILKITFYEGKSLSQEQIERLHKIVLLNPYVATNESVHITKGEEDGMQWLQVNYSLSTSEKADAVKLNLRDRILKEVESED